MGTALPGERSACDPILVRIAGLSRFNERCSKDYSVACERQNAGRKAPLSFYAPAGEGRVDVTRTPDVFRLAAPRADRVQRREHAANRVELHSRGSGVHSDNGG